MSIPFSHYQESATSLQARLNGFTPELLLVLGSGLRSLGEQVENPIIVPYTEVPHMNPSTAPGHDGRFLFGRLAGRDVAVMQGRLHTYEGYGFDEVSFPIRVLHLLGAKAVILTNAAGGVNTAFEAGDIMMITDHIKLFGVSPLCGKNLSEFGPRFPDVSHIYTPSLQTVARNAAQASELKLQEGVYMYFPGPQFETPAEVRLARILGADAAGMSTVPEAITAAHCGMAVLGFTLVTNMGAGVLDAPLSEEEVIEVGEVAGPRFSAFLRSVLSHLPEPLA